MSTGRLEAFSDGVLAVVITILVLELRIEPGAALGEQLRAEWPTFLAYLVSFVVVGVVWVQHHALFSIAERVDRVVLFLNLLLLLAVSLLPFAAKAVGAYLDTGGSDARGAIALYGGLMEVMAIAFTLILRRILYAGLTRTPVTRPDARAAIKRFGLGLIAYPAVVALGLISPTAALVGFGLVVAAYLMERTPTV